jgi:hypothetical protein
MSCVLNLERGVNVRLDPHDHSSTVRITRLVEVSGEVFCSVRGTALPPDVPPDDALPNNTDGGGISEEFRAGLGPESKAANGPSTASSAVRRVAHIASFLSLDDLAEHDMLAVEPGFAATVRKAESRWCWGRHSPSTGSRRSTGTRFIHELPTVDLVAHVQRKRVSGTWLLRETRLPLLIHPSATDRASRRVNAIARHR